MELEDHATCTSYPFFLSFPLSRYCSAAILSNVHKWNREYNIAREDARTLTLEDFQNKYELPCKPVVLTNIVNQWPVWKYGLWTKNVLRMTIPEIQQHLQNSCDNIASSSTTAHASTTASSTAGVVEGECGETKYACGAVDMTINNYLTYAERVMHEDSPLCTFN